MSKHEMLSRVENGKELVLERVFDAPREWVFKFFKEPEYLKHCGEFVGGNCLYATSIFAPAVYGITA